MSLTSIVIYAVLGALGPTGARVLKAALITAGIIHGASLAISTAKLGFDIWFEQHKCCGIHKSICSDYDEYKGIKDRVLAKSEEIDNHWLTGESRDNFTLSTSSFLKDYFLCPSGNASPACS